MTITVAKLKEVLDKLPPDAECYAYEGEVTAIIVIDKLCELAVIHASEFDARLEPEPVIRRR